jgi:hypothetical protein
MMGDWLWAAEPKLNVAFRFQYGRISFQVSYSAIGDGPGES